MHQTPSRREVGKLVVPCPALDDLKNFATVLAAELAPGDVLLLRGDLGAGKTTLTQFLAQSLGVDAGQYVASPSFALIHEYQGRLPIFHMDLYRLTNEDDVEAAGLLDFFDQQGLCVVEWPDRLGTFAPDEYLEISIEPAHSAGRQCVLVPKGTYWHHKLDRIETLLARSF